MSRSGWQVRRLTVPSPLLSSLLFDTPRADPATYTGALGPILLLAIGASALPARRAMSIDPGVALRHE
jgi:hypothetical protein